MQPFFFRPLQTNRREAHRLLRIAFVPALVAVSCAALADPPVTPCVTNVTELRQAIAAASSGAVNDNVDNYINIAVGTYSTNNSIFQYGSAKTKTLHLTGGFNNTCTEQIQDPRYTILSGVGSSKLILQSNSAGDVSIRFLTFVGGNVTTGGSALSMNTAGATGQVIIDYDIFTANNGGNAVVDVGGSTLVQVDGNLFYGNSASTAMVSSGSFISVNTPLFYATNNTFTLNTLTDNVNSSAVLKVIINGSGASAEVSNNIIYGDTIGAAAGDIYIGGIGTATLLGNDEGNLRTTIGITPTIAGDFHYDPQFVSATDFHVQPQSYAIGAGNLTPPGGLPQIDIEGHARTYNSTVDVGAYQRGDDIFADGFEF